jgi:endonuclease/exonuclease/phosphatase family metal-dependent hydrolase
MFREAFLVALVCLSLLALPRGAGSTSALCSDTAPWLLSESMQAHDPGAVTLAVEKIDLNVVTYNLHSGLGLRHAFFRGRARVERNLREIAASIAAAVEGGPDIVALNEVDFGSRRSGWVDEARFIADQLASITGDAYRVFEGETWRRSIPGLEVRFGNAALVRLPVVEAIACRFDDLSKCGFAPTVTAGAPHRRGNWLARLLSEPRGAIRVTVEAHGREADILVTHLDAFDVGQRESDARLLLERFVRANRTTVLLGDMNAVPISLTRSRPMFSDDRTHAILATGSLADASIMLASHRRQASLAGWATYPADLPIWGLDWVLGSLDLAPEAVAAIGTTASDHRGLYVRYRCLRADDELRALRLRHDQICERFRAYDANCPLAGG